MVRSIVGPRVAAAFAAVALGLAHASAAQAQQAVLVSSKIDEKVTVAEQRQFVQKLVESQLSPEMHAVVAWNGEFRGFTRTRPNAVPVDAQPEPNPYRAVIVAREAPANAQDAASQFFKAAPAPAGFAVPASDAGADFQVSYNAGAKIGENELRDAGFTVVKVDGKAQIVDLGMHGGAITVRPTAGAVDKAKVEAVKKLKGLKYFAPVYPVEYKQQPPSGGRRQGQPTSGGTAVPVHPGDPTGGIREPNEPHYANTSPDLPNLWGMRNINAPKAWAKYTDASDIVVAVIDTGVDYRHVDLKDNMWVNAAEVPNNGIDDDNNGYIDDVHGIGVGPRWGGNSDPDGHGTHCAGTIGGVGDNGKGVVGVCWRVKVMGIRFLGGNITAAAAVKYAVDNGASVLSNSWTSFSSYDQGLSDAIEYAKDKNAIFVAAAANASKDNDSTPYYPSSYDNENLIAVGAIGRDQGRASFSNWGKTRVDLFAPGVGIWSTIPNNYLDSFGGTSMACPHVSGACALVWSAKGRAARWSDVRAFILSNARPVSALQNLCATGGTLDIGKLVDGGDIVVPNPAAGALLAYDTFAASDNVAPDGNGLLRAVTVTVTKPTVVVAAVSFDYQPNGADAAFTVAVASAAQPWPGSARSVGGTAGKWTAFAMHAPKKLDAGTHVIQVQTAGGSGVKFGSGAITVTGYAAESDGTAVLGRPAATAAGRGGK